jgi:hypothetical protein
VSPDKGISPGDPDAKASGGQRSPAKEIRLQVCAITGDELRQHVPKHLANRARPHHTRGLIKALADVAREFDEQFVIPYIHDLDLVVYVIAHQRNGVERVLQVSVNDPRPGWRLRPLNVEPSIASDLMKKIRSYSMATVTASSQDW